MPYDRDEVLERTDLDALCEEVLGPRKGTARSGTWPCPAPEHGPQTGRTPPLGVFRTPAGDQRWRCHGCGAGGTALDLVMVSQGLDFRTALEVLARRAGVAERDPTEPRLRLVPPPPPERPVRPSRELEAYVVSCEAYLWSARGQPFRGWLAQRGFDPPVLRANRVGADPGPGMLPRPRGLPRGGPAVVFPVLGADRHPAYLQARYLRHPIRRWENPATAVVGSSPRLGEVRLPRRSTQPGVVVVCEGLPDALSAAQAGWRAVAVLGAAMPDAALAAEVAARFAHERLVLAFDADGAGQAGAEKLMGFLEAAGAGHRVRRLDVAPHHGDLNGWLMAERRRFGRKLGIALTAPARPRLGLLRDPEPPGRALAEDLEALRYHHVLIDDPERAEANAAAVAEVARRWRTDRSCPSAGPAVADRALWRDLEGFAWRHVLVDDDAASQRALTQLGDEARRWSAELARARGVGAPAGRPGGERDGGLAGRSDGALGASAAPPRARSLPPLALLRPPPPSLGVDR